MAEILVLVDHVDGAVKKVTIELLTLARRLGEPGAVLVGAGLRRRPGRAGRVRRGQGLRRRRTPALDGLRRRAQGRGAGRSSSATASPAAVLVASTAEGKEIAARLAVKLGSGLITDAVDVSARARRHAVGLRRLDRGARPRSPRARRSSRSSPNATAAGAVGRRRASEVDVDVDVLRRRQGGQGRRPYGRRGEERPARADRGRRSWSPAAAAWAARGLRARRGARRRARRGRRRVARRHRRRAGTRTSTRSARPARPSRRSCTSPTASPGRSSTARACRPPRRSSRSTRTPRRRSSSSPTSASSATCTRSLPQLTEEIEKRKG